MKISRYPAIARETVPETPVSSPLTLIQRNPGDHAASKSSRRHSFRQLIALIRSDMYRYHGRLGYRECLRLLIQERGFVASCTYRLARFAFLRGNPALLLFAKILHRLCQEFYHFEIPCQCQIGPGLQIYHLYGLILNSGCILGRNTLLSHGVTLGSKPSGRNAGNPLVLDNVYIAPGAKIVGGITIGNHAVIGANAVVTGNIPAYGVAAGIPARVLNVRGSGDYCLHTDYEDKIANLPPPPLW